jgi:hypothetical protein
MFDLGGGLLDSGHGFPVFSSLEGLFENRDQ